VGAGTAGGNLWGNIQTRPELAFGVSQPTSYGDPTAILNGVWGPEQTAQATVKINTTPAGNGYCEAEVRLRTTIGSKSITGYEVYCSVMPDNQYCHIASWGGPNGVWVNMNATSLSMYLHDGDILKGTASGINPVTITMFVNGAQVMVVKDSGTYTFSDGKHYGPWTSGNPGIGFFDSQKNTWNQFGFSSFTASDGVTAAALLSAPMILHKGNRGDIIEILDLKGRILVRNYRNRNGPTFPASQLFAPGVYMVKIVSGNNCALQRFFLDNGGCKHLYFSSKQVSLQTIETAYRGRN
jgi:hypothetical protein